MSFGNSGGFSSKGRSRQAQLNKLEQLFSEKPNSQEQIKQSKQQEASNDAQTIVVPNAKKSPAPSTHKMKLERIKVAKQQAELEAAIEAFLAQHEPPADLDVLLKFLQHSKEAVVRKGLAEIVTLLNYNQLQGGSVILDALQQLEPRLCEEQSLSYVQGIRNMLQKKK